MGDFPTGFPPPQRSSYLARRKPQTIDSDMEVGPPLSRRISTARSYSIPVELVIDDAQMATWQDWFDDRAGAAGGVAWFSGLALDIGDGQGVRTTVECKIVGEYELSRYKSSRKWLLKFTVETR